MPQKQDRLLGVSFWIFLISIILLPIFFIPSKSVPVFFGKTLLLSLGVCVSFLLFFIRFIKIREVTLPSPKKIIFLAPILILSVTFFSSIFNNQRIFSLVGYGFEVDTFALIFLFFSVYFLTILLFPLYKNSGSKAILWFTISFIVLAVFQISRLILGANFLSFGIFFLKTDSLIGGWNELAFFSGSILLLSVFFLDRPRESIRKFLFLPAFLLSIIFLILINFWTAWFLVFIALVFFVFLKFLRKSKILKNKNLENAVEEQELNEASLTPRHGKRILTFSVSSLILTSLFVLPLGGYLSNYLNNSLATSYLDVKPSWSATSEVFSKTIKEERKQFFFGSGPNTFLFQWRKWKPDEVNQSSFWNSEFHHGAGLIPTFFVTTGVLGSLSWIIFILAFLKFGIAYVLKNPKETFAPLFLFLATYFWVTSFVYPVSHSLFIFTAFFCGLFVVAASKKNLPNLTLSSNSKPSINMTLTFVLVILLIISLLFGLTFFKKTLSALNFNQGVNVYLQGDTRTAENKLKRAERLSSNDVISRYLSEFYLLESSKLVQTISNPSQEEIDNFQKIIRASKDYAEMSVILNPESFENWFQLARFYEFIKDISPEQSEASIESARMSYAGAQVSDPKNPLIDLMQSRLEFSVGDLEKAEKFVKSSIEKKSNYSEAIFLLSRIEATQGNLESAINSAKEGVSLNSREPSAYFHLGLLFYQNNDFKNASESFNKAILLEPQYSNARYFLGLSLAKIGDSMGAIKQFEILSQNYPQNDDVLSVLSSLKREEALEEIVGQEDLEPGLPIEE